MNLTFSKVAVGIKEYLLMTVGMFLYAFGWVACVMPAGGMGGGATGLSMIFHALFPAIPIGTFVFIINALLLIAAGFIVGWNFGIKTIVVPENILEIYTENIDSHNILLVILGAVLAGIGVALSFSQGGSTGGTDIVAMIINKYKTVSYGKIVISSDFFIIGSSLFIATDLATGIATVIYG